MRPGIKQPGRFEAEIKRQRKYFSHHERTLYEEASHRNSSLRRVRGSHGGAGPGGQGPHALASARCFRPRRERVPRCRLFVRQQKRRSRGVFEPGVRFAEQLLRAAPVRPAGSEVIWSPSNANFSHSILFGAIPFTHTGVRAGYAASDTVTLYGGINNGWDQLTDANKGKTVELGASIIPTKALTINVTGYLGKERAVAPGTPAVVGAQDTRNLLNVVATYTINNRMSAGGEILYVSQDRPAGSAKYNGVAGYFTYNLNREWRVAARAEMFDDKNNFHFASTR